MNLCRNLQVCLCTVDEEDATGGVRRFCTPFFCACLSLHSHDQVVGAGCMAGFGRNAGSKSALGLFLPLLFHTSAQCSAPCRTAVRAPMSGRSTHLASTRRCQALGFACFTLGAVSLSQAESFGIPSCCNTQKLGEEILFQKLTFKRVSWLYKCTSEMSLATESK